MAASYTFTSTRIRYGDSVLPSGVRRNHNFFVEACGLQTGIVKPKKPLSASKEKKLKLEKGAKLGEELMITFDEEDLRIKRAEYEAEEKMKANAALLAS